MVQHSKRRDSISIVPGPPLGGPTHREENVFRLQLQIRRAASILWRIVGWLYLGWLILYLGSNAVLIILSIQPLLYSSLASIAIFVLAFASWGLSYARELDDPYRPCLRQRSSFLFLAAVAFAFSALIALLATTPVQGPAISQIAIAALLTVAVLTAIGIAISVANLYFLVHFVLNSNRPNYSLQQSVLSIEQFLRSQLAWFGIR